METKTYAFHRTYWESAQTCTDEERLALFDAMNLFAFEGEDTVFEDMGMQRVWICIKATIESSIKRSKTNSDNRNKGKKTTEKTIVKTTVKTNDKTNDVTDEKTIVNPDSIGMEWNGMDKNNFYSSGINKNYSSCPSEDVSDSPGITETLPDGWEWSKNKCPNSHCNQFLIRDLTSASSYCPHCDAGVLNLVGFKKIAVPA